MQYLNSLASDALSGVRLIVATHWHDDHIRGLSSLLKAAPAARFCCSLALKDDHFLTLVQVATDGGQPESGVDEFSEVFNTLMRRKGSTHASLVSPQLAIQNRVLLKLDRSSASLSVAISSLSPSDGTTRKAITQFGSLIPREGAILGSIPDQPENHTSIALWLNLGTRRVLLGADLEHTGRDGEGWLAVLSSKQDAGKAGIYKVPHHGSSNGDYDAIWEELLGNQPFAVVTPFSSGKKLPQPSDISRLLTRTDNLYCTASGSKALPRRDNNVERELRGMTRRAVEGDSGHVRLRWTSSESEEAIRVELFNGAYRA
jgi:hypothetical protein